LTLIAIALAVLAGCTAGSEGSGFPEGTGGGGQGVGGGTDGGLVDFDSGAGGGQGTSCSHASTLVYVIDSDNKFFSFDPSINNMSAFQQIGILNCQGEGPNSMSVSRNGNAYVLYGNTDIFSPGGFACVAVHRVDIETAQCFGPTPFTCGSQGFSKFGMGYATDGADTTAETLYIGNSLDNKLASLDVETGAVVLKGNLPNSGPEFTGNAKGELWGFFPYDDPPRIINLDKNNGAIIQSLSLNGLTSAQYASAAAWAFAYWGDAFYVFYMVAPQDSSTQVYKVDTSGNLTNYIMNTGYTIVGAGVSTCAPIEPPK